MRSLGDDEWKAVVERVALTPPLFNSLWEAATYITRRERIPRAKPGRRQTGPQKSAAL